MGLLGHKEDDFEVDFESINDGRIYTTMRKKEFEQLKADLELAIFRVKKLQKIYRKETGHDFVPPLRLSKDELDWSQSMEIAEELEGKMI